MQALKHHEIVQQLPAELHCVRKIGQIEDWEILAISHNGIVKTKKQCCRKDAWYSDKPLVKSEIKDQTYKNNYIKPSNHEYHEVISRVAL